MTTEQYDALATAVFCLVTFLVVLFIALDDTPAKPHNLQPYECGAAYIKVPDSECTSRVSKV